MENNIPKEFTPFSIRNLRLKNRFIKSATFEGFSKNGEISQELIDFHTRIANGGAALTTVAYGAVSADARTNPDQIVVENKSFGKLQELANAVHNAGCAAMLQLSHCGFFTKNTSLRNKRPLAPSRVLNVYGMLSGIIISRQMSKHDLDRTKIEFGKAAKLGVDAGFDAIEIHMGHGYLLSQFLSPKINKRNDLYGGSLENRMRFPVEVVKEVRRQVGNEFPIFCKINLVDGFKGGVTIEESCIFAKNLEQVGADALVLSGGFTSKTPFYLMRGDIPLKEMIHAETTFSQKMAFVGFGKIMIRKYPFKENFWLPMSLQVRKTVKIPLVYVGGIISQEGINSVMDAGFDLIAIGRALIHSPDFISKLKAGSVLRSNCRHCNGCVGEMEGNGLRCVY